MILVLIEHESKVLTASSLECLEGARGLAAATGDTLAAVAMGEGASSLAAELAGSQVERLYASESEALAAYAPDAWAASLQQLAQEHQPEAILAAGTDRGQEVLARLAARMGLPMAANCTAFEPGEPFVVERQRWGGSLLEQAELTGSPMIMSIAEHVMVAEGGSGDEPEVVSFEPELRAEDLVVQVKEQQLSAEEGKSLADARVVIGGGRGVGSAEDFALLEALAERLDAAVGGSRVATNNGWRPHSDQIGQTGTRITPELYIACGISGAIQHMVGCRGAKRILAINTDREAPIMSKADYSVLGDLHEILPAIVEEIDRASAN